MRKLLLFILIVVCNAVGGGNGSTEIIVNAGLELAYISYSRAVECAEHTVLTGSVSKLGMLDTGIGRMELASMGNRIITVCR